MICVGMLQAVSNGSPLHSTILAPKRSSRQGMMLTKHARRTRSHRRSSLQAVAAMKEEAEVVIVGGGVAGLCCAKQLKKSGVPFVLLEAADEVGGRVRTDKYEGFTLDHGFQIFLTSYPEVKDQLDYEALDLKPFYAGADVHWNGGFHRVADPFRHPLDGVASIPNAIGSPLDKVRVGLVRLSAVAQSSDGIFKAEETTIENRLRNLSFSEEMIDRFFRPFLGGIFFDNKLQTTSRLFTFVMRMLALGSNCLPAAGIAAVSNQLVAGLPEEAVRTGARVAEVRSASGETPSSVVLADGTVITASKGVVVAVEGPEAGRLLGASLDSAPSQEGSGVGTACIYFSAPKPYNEDPILYLNGDGKGLVNNCTFLSNVAPSYAPSGQALLSVSVVGIPDLTDEELIEEVKEELADWFGKEQSASWRPLKVYRIPFSQPPQSPPTNAERSVRLGDGLYVCGDHRETATLDGAFKSGRRAAEAICEDAQS